MVQEISARMHAAERRKVLRDSHCRQMRQLTVAKWPDSWTGSTVEKAVSSRDS